MRRKSRLEGAIQLKNAAPDAIFASRCTSRVVTCKTGLMLAKLANITLVNYAS